MTDWQLIGTWVTNVFLALVWFQEIRLTNALINSAKSQQVMRNLIARLEGAMSAVNESLAKLFKSLGGK